MSHAARADVAGGSAKQVAYDHIRTQLSSRSRREPHFLGEEEVARALGVSRTPVREAFLRLEAEGLLQLVPRRGALIPALSEREIAELMEVRAIFEHFAAERALARDERAREGFLERLETALAAQEGLVDDGDATAYLESDRAFHHEIVRAAGNQLLGDLYQRLRDRQLGMGLVAIGDDPHRKRAVCAEHARILEAFRAGELQAVQAAITDHLETTTHALRAGGGLRQ
jgi:DNA-binding GntR family transcriptional regulator